MHSILAEVKWNTKTRRIIESSVTLWKEHEIFTRNIHFRFLPLFCFKRKGSLATSKKFCWMHGSQKDVARIHEQSWVGCLRQQKWRNWGIKRDFNERHTKARSFWQYAPLAIPTWAVTSINERICILLWNGNSSKDTWKVAEPVQEARQAATYLQIILQPSDSSFYFLLKELLRDIRYARSDITIFKHLCVKSGCTIFNKTNCFEIQRNAKKIFFEAAHCPSKRSHLYERILILFCFNDQKNKGFA